MVRGAGDPIGVVRRAREQLLNALEEGATVARSEALRWSAAARSAVVETDAESFREQAQLHAADAALREWTAETVRAAVAPGSAREAALVARIGLPPAPARPRADQAPPFAVYGAPSISPGPGPVSTRPTGGRRRSVA